MPEKGKDIVQSVDLTNAFIEKLGNWKRKVEKNNFATFRSLACLMA